MIIPYSRQSIDEDDINAVIEILRSDWLTQGPTVERFEQAVASYCGANHAVAVSSGTSALHIACIALGLESGDSLWTSPNTFVASANCALYCGATVDFIDIDTRTYNMSVDSLVVKLEQAERHGVLPKVVVPVHFAGQSCDMRSIRALADRYGFGVLEDASHAIGSRYLDRPIGGCDHSDITVFSFHPVKIITTGEGGVALTNDLELAARMARLRAHGITRDPGLMSKQSEGVWYYEMTEIGFNYRITDMQCALGLSQLEKLPRFIRRRQEIVARYNDTFHDMPSVRPPELVSYEDENFDFRHAQQVSWHLYVVQIDFEQVGKTRAEVMHLLREKNILTQVHYIPVHLQPYYRIKYGYAVGKCPVAESFYGKCLSLPLFPAMTDKDVDRVVQGVQSAIS